MTDRFDPTALPIFGATPPAETPPNGHQQVPTISLAPTPTSARSLAGPIAGAAPVRAAAVPAPATVPPVPARPAVIAPGGIDWHQVAMLRAQASDQLTAALGEDRGMDPETERELGRTVEGLGVLRPTATDGGAHLLERFEIRIA